MKVNLLQRGGDKSRHADLEESVRFYAEQLMTKRMMNTLNIRVEFRATKLDSGAIGSCASEADGSKSTKDFTITILRDEPFQSQLSILAHEMIHVSQKAYGVLQNRIWKSDKQMHSRWNGVELGLRDELEYLERPWEIEAFGLQGDLSSAFLKNISGDQELGARYLNRFHKKLDGYMKAREEFKNPTNQFQDFDWKSISKNANPPESKRNTPERVKLKF